MLLNGRVGESCRAVIALPARNEEASLPATLDAFAGQLDLKGAPLSPRSFEILLLLNNCSDRSVEVASGWQRNNPEVKLHYFERSFSQDEAHIGTARRLVMDTACARLQGARGKCAILSTDADSTVAPDWIAQTLRAIERGADAVGGVVQLFQTDFEMLKKPVRDAYLADRKYQSLMAELEDILDPQKGDAWPRHLEHFGASLACTPEIYAHAGGLPAVPELEDAAFVDRLRKIDATLRHEPKVVVWTSGRLEGRVSTGLSGQLRSWQRMYDKGLPHCVPTSAWLTHRFRTLGSLRRFFLTRDDQELAEWLKKRRLPIIRAAMASDGTGEFLCQIDCDRLIEETFDGERLGLIKTANEDLTELLTAERKMHLTHAPGCV